MFKHSTWEYDPSIETRPERRPRLRVRHRRVFTLGIAGLLVLVLGTSGLILGYRSSLFLSLFNSGSHSSAALTAAPPVAGHLYFESSGQVSLTSGAGIADEVQLDLTQLSPPPPGKRYYAWLITGSVEGAPILLGSLSVLGGRADLFYPGDAQHTNLLAIVNRFLITLEAADGGTPLVPSPDKDNWRYAAAFSQVPNQRENPPYSLLDHLHHLLSSDPILDDPAIGLHGGLDIWLFRDGQKLLEWADSARDVWGKGPEQAALMHRQLIRMVEYLDGWRVALQELPQGTPLLVDSHIALVAMRELAVGQEPPGLLYHVGQHLTGLAESPAASQQQRSLAAQLDAALNRVAGWLDNVHTEALALLRLSAAQLVLPAARSQLDLLATQASYAFSGGQDPATGAVQDGVTQIHYAMPGLATMDIVAVTCSSAQAALHPSPLCL